MSNGIVLTKTGKQVIINRAFKASPDYTVPSKFKIGTGTTTPTTSDTDLNATIGAFGSANFVAGYPIIDETTMQVTFRGAVLVTDANGNTITEYGSFNTDGTPKMMTRMVFTGISKTNSVQIIFVEKDKIQL